MVDDRKIDRWLSEALDARGDGRASEAERVAAVVVRAVAEQIREVLGQIGEVPEWRDEQWLERLAEARVVCDALDDAAQRCDLEAARVIFGWLVEVFEA